MTKKQNIIGKRKSETDWDRIDAMTDDDIDYSDIPAQNPEEWKSYTIHPFGLKVPITIRIEKGIISWFKLQTGGRGYQTAINEVLKEYVKSREKKSA